MLEINDNSRKLAESLLRTVQDYTLKSMLGGIPFKDGASNIVTAVSLLLCTNVVALGKTSGSDNEAFAIFFDSLCRELKKEANRMFRECEKKDESSN